MGKIAAVYSKAAHCKVHFLKLYLVSEYLYQKTNGHCLGTFEAETFSLPLKCAGSHDRSAIFLLFLSSWSREFTIVIIAAELNALPY
jgi:hypothetical protein